MSLSSAIDQNNPNDDYKGKFYPDLIPWEHPEAQQNLGQVLAVGNQALNPTTGLPQSATDFDTLGCISIETGKVYQGNNLDLEIGEAGDTLKILGATTKGSILVGNGAETKELPIGANGLVLKANSAQPLGVEWGTDASGGTVMAVNAGTNISVGGTIAQPVVNLATPLTSTLGMGSVALTDKNGASGLAGQFLSAGTGGETLWATPPPTPTPTIDAVLGAGDTAINKELSLNVSGVNASQINLNPVGQNATISLYTDNGGGSNQKYITLINPVEGQGSSYPRPTIRAGTSATTDGLGFDIDGVVSAIVDKTGIKATSGSGQSTFLKTEDTPQLNFTSTLSNQSGTFDKSQINFSDTTATPVSVIGQYSVGGFANTTQDGTGDSTQITHSQSLGVDYISQTNLTSGVQTQINNEVNSAFATDNVSYSVPSTLFETKINSTANSSSSSLEVKYDDPPNNNIIASSLFVSQASQTKYLASCNDNTGTAQTTREDLTLLGAIVDTHQVVDGGTSTTATRTEQTSTSLGVNQILQIQRNQINSFQSQYNNLSNSQATSHYEQVSGGATQVWEKQELYDSNRARIRLRHTDTGGISHSQSLETTGFANTFTQAYSNTAVGTRNTTIQTGSTGLTIACDNAVAISSGTGTPISLSTTNATIGMNTAIGLTSVSTQSFSTSQVGSASVPQYVFQNNNSSNASYPAIQLNRTGVNSVAGDVIGSISMYGLSSAGTSTEWARIQTKTENVSPAGNRDGTLSIFNIVDGTLAETFNFNGGQNENNSFRPLDMNGNQIRTTTGDMLINASVSSGNGGITLSTKNGTGSLAITGDKITSATAGGSTGHHLVLTLPDPTTGLPRVYKIALLNP